MLPFHKGGLLVSLITHLSAGASIEEHDPRPCIGESGFQQADSDRQSHTSGAEWPHALVDRPWVTLNITDQVSQVHVNAL